jgi:hypothetical protein
MLTTSPGAITYASPASTRHWLPSGRSEPPAALVVEQQEHVVGMRRIGFGTLEGVPIQPA